jgi:hypothetical protein
MCRTLSLLLLVATFAVAGCARSLPAPAGSETSEVRASPQERAELEKKAVERMREEEGIFDALVGKMDDYQDLLAVCDAVSPAPEDSEIKASCTLRLEAMKKELSDLSDLLRDGR